MPPAHDAKAGVWRLDGEYYDFGAFEHPGGPWMVSLSEGHDVTHLFHSYHAAASQSKLLPYRVDEAGAKAKATEEFFSRATAPPRDAPAASPDPRLPAARAAIEAATGRRMQQLKPPMWGWAYYFTSGVLYLAAAARWWTAPSWRVALVLGFTGWIFAGFMQHEGSHAALSRRPLINLLGRLSIIPWANPRTWFITHVVQHHVCVNTKMDPDFQSETGGIIRHHPHVPYNWQQSLQLALVHMPFVTFGYSLADTFRNLLTLGPRWGESLLYVACAVGLHGGHYYVHGDLLLAVAPQFAFGFCFVTVTQWSHVQEECNEAVLLDSPPQSDFMGHQVRTCVDYSHGSLSASALSIFLNYQSYHHMFPGVSHFHFFDKGVKACLDDFLDAQKIPRVSGERSLSSVIWAYVCHMRNLARPHPASPAKAPSADRRAAKEGDHLDTK